MEGSDPPNEHKSVSKAKSRGPPVRLKSEQLKRKSLNVNDAVKSLDLALGRLKKSKLMSECGSYTSASPIRSGIVRIESMVRTGDMFMSRSSNLTSGIDNASLMSLNFSHYELIRNLSHTNCNSDSALSGATGTVYRSPTDLTVKDEHLEKYFRSAEIWNRNYRDGGPSDIGFKLPKKL